MSKIDDFKDFARRNPNLITHVKSGEMNWQKFYEIYDLYGEDENVWNNYVKREEKHEEVRNTSNRSIAWSEMLNMAKNMDVDKVQEGITSIQKAIGLVSDLFIKDKKNTTTEYQPRPLYKRFDD